MEKGLLMKLNDIGIHGNMYNWIKFSLTDRTIQTKLNDAISSKEVLEDFPRDLVLAAPFS